VGIARRGACACGAVASRNTHREEVVLGAAAWAHSVHVETFIRVEREDNANTRSLPPAPHLRTTCRNQRGALRHNNGVGWCVNALHRDDAEDGNRGAIVVG
jgi:hypothetical protein